MEFQMSNVTLALSEKAALSVNEFCVTCSIGRTSFYELVKQGRIKVRKLGNRTIIPAGEVSAFLDSLSTLAVRS